MVFVYRQLLCFAVDGAAGGEEGQPRLGPLATRLQRGHERRQRAGEVTARSRISNAGTEIAYGVVDVIYISHVGRYEIGG